MNSAFKDSGLLEYLISKDENKLIIAGLQTEYCIDTMVKCGFEHGFEMIVPEHGNTTIDNNFMTAENSYKYYNVFMWPYRYAKCISLKETRNFMGNKKYHKKRNQSIRLISFLLLLNKNQIHFSS
nr:isochorismatase family protein [Listeria seeligeri]